MSKAIAIGTNVRNEISLTTSDTSHCVCYCKNTHYLTEIAPQPKFAFPSLSVNPSKLKTFVV